MITYEKIAFFLFLLTYSSVCRSQNLTIPDVDNTTYEGKVMFGYQGWFAHPNDKSVRPKYWHWGNLSEISLNNQSVEMYPDLREYCSDEKFLTSYTFFDGDTSPVFSSGNKHTVMRHIKWIRDYNVDGVFLQRFISEYGDKVVMQFRDSVTQSVMEASQLYKRVFAIMYDGVGNAVENIKNDWIHLVDDLKILDNPSYLHHNGLPLVALWGFTFYDNASVDQLANSSNGFIQKPTQNTEHQ